MTPSEHEVFAEMVGALKEAQDKSAELVGAVLSRDPRAMLMAADAVNKGYPARAAILSRAQALPDPGARVAYLPAPPCSGCGVEEGYLHDVNCSVMAAELLARENGEGV